MTQRAAERSALNHGALNHGALKHGTRTGPRWPPAA